MALPKRKLALAVIAIIGSFAADVDAMPTENLFIVARSKNANIVRYDVHRNGDGHLDCARPIDAYWLMLAENGHREELSWMERELAYGFSVLRVSTTGFSLQLAAFKQREIRVEYSDGVYRARVVIFGKWATLNRVFVRAEEGGLIPRVQYVELRGTTESGTVVTERIIAP